MSPVNHTTPGGEYKRGLKRVEKHLNLVLVSTEVKLGPYNTLTSTRFTIRKGILQHSEKGVSPMPYKYKWLITYALR